MKKLLFLILVFLIAGCVSKVSQTEQQYYNVYDEQGKRQGYIKEQGGNYILYDENWKRKGYIKAE